MYDSFLADLAVTAPILLVAGLGVVVVLLDAFRNDDASIPWIAGVGMTAAAVWQAFLVPTPGVAFEGQVYVGGAAAIANVVVLVGAVASLALTVPYLSRLGRNFGEVHALILFATAGMMTLASAGSLVTLFVGLETMSVCLYVLTGLVREESTANESALKYFLLGAFSTGFFLYGLALLYGATGTMELALLAEGVAATGRTGLFLAGVGLLLVGFFFKVSAVPFHMWTPDVYQGAPTSLTAFMSTASKAATFAALAVVLSRALPPELVGGAVQVTLAVVAAVTMVAGNVLALVQTNVKRMLAYSSVAHAGYILAGLAAGSAAGYGASLFYLLAYTLMNVGAFGVMGALEWDGEQGGRPVARQPGRRRLPQAVPGRRDGRVHVRADRLPAVRRVHRQVPRVLGRRPRRPHVVGRPGRAGLGDLGGLLPPGHGRHVDAGARGGPRQRPPAVPRRPRHGGRRGPVRRRAPGPRRAAGRVH